MVYFLPTVYIVMAGSILLQGMSVKFGLFPGGRGRLVRFVLMCSYCTINTSLFLMRPESVKVTVTTHGDTEEYEVRNMIKTTTYYLLCST